MALTLSKIEEIAPDQGSLAAARKLLKAQSWPTLASDEAGLMWGECQGSGSSPYRVVVSELDLGYKCTCPSRKFPCKHSLALMWMRAESRRFQKQERPAWVNDWLARRRGPAKSSKPETDEPKPKASIAATAEAEVASDPKAEARAAAARERGRAEREAAILAGLDQLDRWIIDQVERGLAGFQSVATEQCRLLARRLADAKASGLAARVERLPADLFGLPEPMRADFLIERLGELHLIAEAYRRQSELPEALRADLRLTVGWTMTREALLTEPQVLKVRDRWMVLATVNEVQPDKLRRLETWLARLGEGEGPRFAALIDFVPVSAGAVATTNSPGEIFEAALAFYPSCTPLRAVTVERFGGIATGDRWPAPPSDLTAALDDYDAKLAARPWLGEWPVAVRDAIVVRQDDGLVLTGSEGGSLLPIKMKDDDMILPLVGVAGIDAFGLWDGRRLDLRFAETPLGRWVSA
jgi:SWIM zinc finger